MKIKLLTSIAGENWHANCGQVIDHEDVEAARFIEAGIAVAAPDDETAALESSENAMNKPAKNRKKA